MRLASNFDCCAVAVVARPTAVRFFTGSAAALVAEQGSVNSPVAAIKKIIFISE